MKASCRISFEVHLVGTCQSNARIGLQMCGNADKTLGGLGTQLKSGKCRKPSENISGLNFTLLLHASCESVTVL